jgi:hypothetical protein
VRCRFAAAIRYGQQACATARTALEGVVHWFLSAPTPDFPVTEMNWKNANYYAIEFKLWWKGY